MALFRRTYPFLLLCALFFGAGAAILVSLPKTTPVIWANGHHTPFLDVLVLYWTWWGEGWMNVALVVILCVFAGLRHGRALCLRYAWLGLLCFALPSLMSVLLKNTFFHGAPRPAAYIDFRLVPGYLHVVPGAPVLMRNSFPSGHTITAFSVALFGMYLLGERPRPAYLRWTAAVLLFVWACSVGYSRLYLAAHFFTDVYGGAFIGLVCTMAAIWIGERRRPYPSPYNKSL